MRASRTIITSFTAAAFGAGVALLFAPQSGARTRRRIRHITEDLVQNLREDWGLTVHDACERGTHTAHRFGAVFAPKRDQSWSLPYRIDCGNDPAEPRGSAVVERVDIFETHGRASGLITVCFAAPAANRPSPPVLETFEAPPAGPRLPGGVPASPTG